MPQHPHGPRDTAVATIHAALMHMRRYMSRPPNATLPQLPGLPKVVDFAQVCACEAIHSLSETAGPVTVKDVACELTLDHSTASRLLTHMTGNGLAARSRDPKDRRRTTVNLTTDGERVAVAAEHFRNQFLSEILSSWTDAELDQFASLLDRFAGAVGDQLAELINGRVPAALAAAVSSAKLARADSAGVSHR